MRKPLTPRPLTGAAGIAQVIADLDHPVVYGMPGGHMIQVFDALRDLGDRVECVLVREEAIGSVMAEAHGRLTGQPAVVMGQGAWVLGNAGIGIMEAHLGSSPMVVLVDATEGAGFSHHGPYQDGMSSYGGYELYDAMKAITKRAFLALDPIQAIQMTQLAFKHATEGEPGPVAVVFHSHAITGAVPEEAGHPRLFPSGGYWEHSPRAVDHSAAAAAVRLLAGAERPVVVAGNGVRVGRAEEALARFLRAADIPAVTTPAGKGTVDERSGLGAGVIGMFGHDAANRLLGDADVVLAIGTKLSASDTSNENPRLLDPARQTIIQVDVEPLNLGWTTPIDLGLLGDAEAVLGELLASGAGGLDGDGTRRVAELRAAERIFEPSGFGGRAVVDVLARTLPGDAIVTCDAGENRLFMLGGYRVGAGGSMLQPNGGGGMGYAIPAAMAAARLGGGRRAVAVCGDGGFSMTMQGLMSAIENDIPLTVVVLDNHALGWVLHGQGDRPFLSEYRDFDLAAIAAAIGCTATSATDERTLQAALGRALEATSGVHVIVARTTREDTYQDMISELGGVDLEAVSVEN